MIIYAIAIKLAILLALLEEAIARRDDPIIDLVGPFPVSPGWSISKVNKRCNQTIESENGVIQIDKGLSSSKTFTNLKPHWNIQVDASVYIVGKWGNSNLAQFYIDGVLREQTVQSFPHPTIHVQGYRYVYAICQDFNYDNNDGYVQWSPNITHTATSVTLLFKNDLDPSSSGKAMLGFNNIRIFLDLCDDTCLTCSGPTENQCTSCPPGSTLVGGKCQCNGSTVAYQYQCLASCPAGMWADPNMKKCVPKCVLGVNYCVECADERSCSKCTGGYNLLKGDCIDTCPRRYDPVGGVCVPVEQTFKRGTFLFGGLNTDPYNDDKLIDQRDFDGYIWNLRQNTTTNPLSQYYVCKGGERMLGGYQISGDGAITKSFTNIPYHWRVRVKVKLWQIDSWNNEQLQVETDGNVNCQQTHWFDNCPECKNFCGWSASFVDKVGSCDVTYPHDGNSLTINFRFFADQDTWNESLAISDLYIIIDECPNQLCNKCNEDKCFSCVPGAYLLNDICVNPCPDGMYGDDVTKHCEKCNVVCETCVKSSTNCIKCAEIRYGASPPVCDCPSGKYDNPPVNYTCFPCDYICDTCQTTSKNCTKCAANRPDLTKPQCKCPSHTYDQGDPLAFCPDCIYKCAECEKNAHNCTKCAGANRLAPPQCKCADGFFDDGKSPDCQPCFKYCRTCEGEATNCIDCVSNRVAPKCNCPEFTYDDGSLTCNPCSYQCKTCQGDARTCLTCAGNRLKNPPDCPCPPGYNEAGYPSCIECIYKCKECTSDKANCVTCAENRVQNPPTCPCPDGTYETLLARCPDCNYKCATCEKSADNCIKCAHPSRGNPPTCACLDGYYDDGVSVECKKCDSKCVGCTEKSTKCIQCAKNRVLPDCNCADGFYADAFGNCQKCHPNCFRCTGPGPNDCATCAENRLDYPSCVCPPGTYDDGTPQCKPCHPVCKQCTGPESYQCKECSGNKIYNPVTKGCGCKDGTFDAGPDSYCPVCSPQCAACVGNPDNCTQCKSNRTLESQCKSCVAGYYDNGTDVNCQLCNNKKCLTCADSESNCTICLPNRTNPPTCGCQDGMFEAKGGECLQCSPQCATCVDNPWNCTKCTPRRAPTCGCPSMQYEDSVSGDCLKCNPNCLECDNSQICRVCKPGRQNYPYCTCPSGQYFQETSFDCAKCDFQCTACFTRSSNCSICRGNRENAPTCTCPAGFFEANEDDCRTCLPKCAECTGNEGNCTKCADGRVGFPICNCKEGTYEDKRSGRCNTCFPTCATCFGEGQFSCYRCQPGLIYKNGECRAQDTFYFDPATKTIQNCNPTCGGCEYTSDNCYKCNPMHNRVLTNGKCVCQSGYDEIIDAHNQNSVTCIPIYERQIQCNTKSSGVGVLYLKECDCNSDEYYNLKLLKCSQCSVANCKTCTSETKCGECIPSAVLQNDGTCKLEVVDQSSQKVLVAILFVIFGFGLAIWIPLAIRKVYLRYVMKNPILSKSKLQTNMSKISESTDQKTKNISVNQSNNNRRFNQHSSMQQLQYFEEGSQIDLQ